MARRRKRVTASRTAAIAQPGSAHAGWLLGLLFLAANLILAGYFLDAIPSPNPTSRALPILTLHEEGRYAIDTYEKETMDKSFINGHYYSDKAPLTTWVTLPVYDVAKALGMPDASGRLRWLPIMLIGSVVCGTIPFAILAWMIFRRLLTTVSTADAVVLSMLPLYGSCVFAYSGVYMGHLLAGAFLCGSYELLRTQKYPALSGFLLGLGVLTEFPVALAVPIWLWQMARRDRRALMSFVAGGLPCAIALLFYNHAITGSYFKMPYDFVADNAFSQMRSAYGVRLPQVDALWGLLFSEYRGLFYYAPALAVVAVWYVATRRLNVFRDAACTPIGILSVAYVLLISSYFVWWGGWAYGPRHLIPLAMLLFYVGIPAYAEKGSFRGWVYAVSIAGLGMVWLAKSTTLHIMPEQYVNPVFDLAWPAFLGGRLRHDAIPSQFFGVNPLVAAWMWVALFVLALFGLRLLAQRRHVA